MNFRSRYIALEKTKSVLQISAIVFCALFLCLGLASESKAAEYHCNSCADCQEKINSAPSFWGNTIYLDNNIFNNNGTCLEFDGKSNITFDCSDGVGGRYVIDGVGNGYGLYFHNNSNNNVVKNCYITGFSNGIYANNSDNITLFNLIISFNSNSGLYWENSDSVNMSSVYINNNDRGIYLSQSNTNTIDDCELQDNNHGIYLSLSSNSNFSNIIVKNSGYSGIYLNSSSNNNFAYLTVFNNNIYNSVTNYGLYFWGSNNNIVSTSTIKWNNNYDIYLTSDSASNLFYDNNLISKDKVKDDGANLWNINYFGNHWDGFDDKSEGCFDSFNGNGICDDGSVGDINYVLDADSADNAPKYIGSITEHYCHTCIDCNNKIASATPSDIIYLLGDISSQNGDCIDLSWATSTIFDCQDYKIYGDNDIVGNGIYLNNGNGSGNITIKNCKISDFNNGIYVDNSNDNTIIGNIVKNNINYDIYLNSGLSNIFYNNKFIDNNAIYGVLGNYCNNRSGSNNIAPGNYWEAYDGINDTCVDSDGDGYCDSSYFVGGFGPWKVYDNYPHYQGPYNSFTCDSCADCSAKIAAAGIGDTITLTKTIINATTTCIEFNNKQNITFDCNSFSIDGIGNGYGVYIYGSSLNDNNTVKNCYITDFDRGVYINSSNANFLDNIKLFYNQDGVHFLFSNSNVVNTTQYIHNNHGVYLDSSYSNIFSFATSSYNNIGFYFDNSGSNIIKNSTGIKFNPVNIEINSDGGSANIFYDNYFISPNKIIDNSSLTQWDDGIGIGNWWESYDTDDENCFDSFDGNGICDSAYTVGSLGTTDQYPIWKAVHNNTYYCNSCDECSQLIQNALYGDKVILNSYILGETETCINFGSYKEGIVFNGDDYFIQGNNDYYGVYLEQYNEDNTVKNLNLSNFNIGIYSEKNNNFNIFSHISSSYNSTNGLEFDNSGNNVLEYVDANYNNIGIQLKYSDNNKLTYIINTVNSLYGLYLYDSDNTIISSSTYRVNSIDIKIDSNSSGSILYNNELVSNNLVQDDIVGTLWDNGAKGNHWEAYDSNIEGCYDNNPIPSGDGVCDSSYVISVNTDNFPIYKGSSVTYTCASCEECNNYILEADYGDTILLSQNISTNEDCINIEYKSGIVFNCQNYVILRTGSGVGVGTGININGFNISVSNCYFSNFEYGVYLSGNGHSLNNIIVSNSTNGLYVDSDDDSFDNIKLNSNTYGIILNGSHNEFNYATSTNNDTAIVFQAGADYNNLYYGNIKENNLGLSLGSNNNLIASSTIYSNQVGVNISGDYNVIASSTVRLNRDYNIELLSTADNNIFYANQFPSSLKISDVGNNNHWNNWDNSASTNLEPGNHWESYDTQEEGCYDNNSDNICDSSPYYNDNFPMYYGTINAYTCDSCDSCTEAINSAFYGETVQLVQDLTGISDSCIHLTYTEGIIFDGGGQRIIGLGSGDAIYLDYAHNNVIKNLKIYTFDNGVYLNYANSNLEKDIENNFSNIGFYLNNSTNNFIKNSTTTNNITGIYAQSNDGKFYGLNIQNNSIGISFENFASNNKASSSIIEFNDTDIAIQDLNCNNNVFYNNKLTSAVNIQDYGSNTKWDKNFKGNMWGDFDEDSEGCLDDISDGICDDGSNIVPYPIDDGSATNDGGISIDNFPLYSSGVSSDVYYCVDCEDCSAKIASSSPGDTIKLTNDIIGYTSTCIDFAESKGIVFDCQGYLINGNNTGNGIELNILTSNNFIRNCHISNFYNGIYIASGFNSIDNINIEDILNNGIYLNGAYSNNFLDLSVNNSATGTVLLNSDYNIFENCSLSYNETGIGVIQYSDSNQFINIVSNYNINNGIYLGGLDCVMDNIIASSTFKWNGNKDIYVNEYAVSSLIYNNSLRSKSYIIDEQKGVCGGALTLWDDGSRGNWWEDFNDESEGCYDVDDNGLCDDNGSPPVDLNYIVNVTENYLDNHPQYIGSLTEHYCNSCFDCNAKIASTTPGDTVYLAVDIVDQDGHCLDFSNISNIVFDCQGHIIDGDGDNIGNGIYLANSGGSGSITIQNCSISDFNVGINIEGSDVNNFINNTIKNNIANDVFIDNTSDANTFYNNDFNTSGNISDSGASTHWNAWNGTNIAPGNHWDAYDGDGDLCVDNSPAPAGDGYCDIAYPVGSSQDNYPKYIGVAGQYECLDCADCNAKIAGANVGDTIKLTANIVNQSGSCIIFNNSSIIFDCQGYTIDGDNTAGSYGLSISNQSGNIIKNCRFTNFDYGVYFSNVSNSTTTSVNAENNQMYGFFLDNSSNNYFHNIQAINNNSNGIYLNISSFNKFDEMTVNKNDNNGFIFVGSDSNTATSSEIKFNKVNISIDVASDNNTFYNNHFISKYKINDNSATTKWDNGSNLGNWWEAFDTDGECIGALCCANSGGICSNYYEIKTGVSDNYPIYKGINFNHQDKTCNSCSACSAAIQNAYYGERINLIQNINAIDDCVVFNKYQEGITFNGNDYTISGDNEGIGITIIGDGDEYNTIQNLTILSFAKAGVYINGSGNNILFNLSVFDVNDTIQLGSGLKLNYSNNNDFTDIIVNNNYYGIYLLESDYNNFTNIIADNNSQGIRLYIDFLGDNSGSNNNTLSDLSLYYNNDRAIYIYGKDNAITSGSTNIIKYNNRGVVIDCPSVALSNIITNSQIKRNGSNDVTISGSCHLTNNSINKIYNNEFISYADINDYSDSTQWDNGSNLGNWWEDFDDDAEGCYDTDSNGICDDGGSPAATTSYEIKTGVFDHYPKYKGLSYNLTINCDSCDSCTNAINSAYYGATVQLTQDIYADGDCIGFGSYVQGVTFTCQNGTGAFNIIGDGTGNGIYILNDIGAVAANNIIEYCHVSYFDNGLYFNNTDYNIVASSSFNNMQNGMLVRLSDYNYFTNINVDYNKYGLFLDRSYYNSFDNIQSTYGENIFGLQCDIDYGLMLSGANNNTIIKSIFKQHYYNIFVDNASNNNIFNNNYLISNLKVTDNGSGNQWDDNYWEACADSGGGNCVSPYWKDNAPKYDGGGGIITCNNCSDCNNKINNAKYGDTVQLTQNIFNQDGDCIRITYKEGIRLSGNGCVGNCIIDGLGDDSGIFICGTGEENNIISDFKDITGFRYGIYVYGSDNNYFNNLITVNNFIGIDLKFSDSNHLDSLIGANNNRVVYLNNSNNNYLSNSTSTDNVDGFVLDDNSNNNYLSNLTNIDNVNGIHLINNSNNNYLSNSISTGNVVGTYIEGSSNNHLNSLLDINNVYGIYLEDSDNNYLSNSTSTDNSTGIYLDNSSNNYLNSLINTNNNQGIYLDYSDSNEILFSTSTNNRQGIYFNFSNNNIIASSTFKNNTIIDIYIDANSDYNIFYANDFISSSNVSNNNSNTYWTKRLLNASVIPGNHWENYDAAIEGCHDILPPHNYCDTPYDLGPVFDQDFYPIKVPAMPADFNITVAEVGYEPITHSSSTCKVVLMWENNSDADEYIIYRSVDNGNTYSELARVSWGESFYIDENSSDIADSITNGYGFNYYIVARDGPFYKESSCDRLNDLGVVINSHCKEDNGSTTVALYPTICSVDLGATSTDCLAIGLNWNDVSSTTNYYITRDDGGSAYEYSCFGVSDPAFAGFCSATTTILDINSNSHPNDTIYYFQDRSATSSQYFYYQIRNCVENGIPCYKLSKCQPTALGPRDDCYVESNILKINPCQFPAPKWIEVGP